MRPITVTVGPLTAAAANNVCASQTPSTAFTMNGSLVVAGVAILDTPRRILFTPAGAEAGKNVVITGTDWNGNIATETLPLVSNPSTTYSDLDYKTVSSITISSAAAGAITVGTNGVASSRPIRLDEWAPWMTAVQVDVSGTVSYTVQVSLDDPNSPTDPVTPENMTWLSALDTNIVTQTAAKYGKLDPSPLWTRILLNSQTNPGYVTGKFVQASVTPL